MRGDAKKLAKMLQGAQTRFVIPVYQRNYDWKREQCKRFFDDLEDVVQQSRESHFFGSIVSQMNMDRRVLIDGQQRVTTVYLLLAALLRQIKSGAIEARKDTLPEFIRYEYLMDRYDESDQKLKLKLVKDDQEALGKIMDEDDHLVEGSNVTENYRYFLERISQTDLSADQLKDAVESLEVIDIMLESDDDAQLIFESLNSTGLSLSEGDKIRNYVLMNLPEDLQNRYYEQYWNIIEANTDYEVSSFIRDYIAAKTRKTPIISRVYPSFRSYAKAFKTDSLLADLLRYSVHYRRIIGLGRANSRVDVALRRLGLLEMSITAPFLLSMLDYADAGNLAEDQVLAAIGIIEDYLFRRWVCNIGTNALNKVFENLHYDAVRGVSDGADYCEALKYSLLRRESNGRFPRDDEFRQSYTERNFYGIGRKRLYLYNCLENRDNVERVNVVDMLEDGTLSVEHIMPQTLSRKWRDSLGTNADAIHEQWLNRMGNLTLTGYNSQYSNNEFSDKRDRDHGFKDSGLKLNRFVSTCESWGEPEMRERDDRIWRRFLTIWPCITTDYHPKAEEHESHPLDEDFNFTNRKVAAYVFQGARHTVKTWVEMMQSILGSLYEIDPAAVRAVAFGDKFPARYFSNDPLEYGFEIGPGLWFDPGNSTATKIEALRRIIERMPDVDSSDLSFELYDEPHAGARNESD